MPTTQLSSNKVRTSDLRKHGFVHVTGLMMYDGHGNSTRRIQPVRRQLGKHDDNNGKMVLITEDGEVWLRTSAGPYSLELSEVVELYAPNGRGACVYCSNGENLTTGDILDRVEDPFCNYHGNPVPEIQN